MPFSPKVLLSRHGGVYIVDDRVIGEGFYSCWRLHENAWVGLFVTKSTLDLWHEYTEFVTSRAIVALLHYINSAINTNPLISLPNN